MASGNTGDATLEGIRNENVDLAKVPLEEVFEQLNCSREGLSTAEGDKRFAYFGPNKLEEKKTAFTTKKDYGRGEREAQWAHAQHTLHSLQPPEAHTLFEDKRYRELSEIAEQAKRRAEVARLRELHTLKGHVESVVKLKGLDIDTIQQHYTV